MNDCSLNGGLYHFPKSHISSAKILCFEEKTCKDPENLIAYFSVE